ncbi:MAG TPA: hypothetical protein VF553_09505 [Pyrinomonadaceae bacterium]
MRRTTALLTLLAIAALSCGCSSMHETGSAPSVNANSTSAAPQSQPTSSSGPTVGGARPAQAQPSPTTGAGIKPPTKNQQ